MSRKNAFLESLILAISTTSLQFTIIVINFILNINLILNIKLFEYEIDVSYI